MKRRAFLGAGAGITAAAVPIGVSAQATAPSSAHASALPLVKWRLTSSFPKSLDAIYGAAETIAKRVASSTDGRFQIQVFAAGEIVPAMQALDAVQNRTVDCAHTAAYFYSGKDAAFTFGTTAPFGLNSRQQNAWIYVGGGLAQMGGWFRKEIRTAADLRGLKFRIGGFAGRVLAKLGAVPMQLAASDIYPALEKGAIDAAEWVGPYDDERLGFHKIAKYYYYPGWWDGGPQLDLFINMQAFAALPPSYQSILEAACAEANVTMLAKYDALNPAALRRLVSQHHVQLRPFSREILDACWDAAQKIYAEESAKNATFKKIYDAWRPFREDQVLWARVAEQNFDRYVAGAQARAGGAGVSGGGTSSGRQ
jgi:TRAP-type mannitol/chloroaromatic compound transport system substrate-binding protein